MENENSYSVEQEDCGECGRKNVRCVVIGVDEGCGGFFLFCADCLGRMAMELRSENNETKGTKC